MATLQGSRQRLSYLLGETTIPSSGTSNRDQFINDVLIDVYQRKEWEWSRTTATLPISSAGLATLPSSVRQEGVRDVRLKGSSLGMDSRFQEIDYRSKDSYDTSAYVYWLTGNAETGNYTLNLNQTNASIVTIQFVIKAPILNNASDTFGMPNGEVIAAKGALMYYRLQEDPQADVTPEAQAFEAEISRLLQMENRGKPITKALTLSEARGLRGIGEY